ncbi:MAG: hypothetical protein ACRDKW_14585, partial [Actinomycetota bacterium]
MQVFDRPAAPPSYWPAPGQLPPLPQPRLSRRARLLVIGLVVLGLVLTATGIAFLAGVVSRLGPNSHPDRWDERVAPLATFVELERGLEFDHPVHVNFLTEAEFREEATVDDGELSGSERDGLESWADQTRALGLTSGEVDMHDAFNSLSGDGTLAYYDPATTSITVRGTEMTVGVEVTLVHELTHALQDQHFGIGREFDTDGADTAFRALVEGDAVRIESYYVGDLTEVRRDAYFEEYDRGYEAASASLDRVPEAIRTLFGAPYPLGEWFVEVILSDGGQRALDAAFRDPPDSELALLNPVSWLARERIQDVEAPELERGERETGRGDLGALTLYTMLAARMDPADALLAIDGWDGDAYVAFEEDGDTCVRFSVAGADRDATGRLHDALAAWAASLAVEAPAVTRSGGLVTAVTCDPGTAARRGPDPGRVDEALTVAVTRTEIVTAFLDDGFTPDEAACVGHGVVTSFTPAEVADDLGGLASSSALQARVDEIVGR